MALIGHYCAFLGNFGPNQGVNTPICVLFCKKKGKLIQQWDNIYRWRVRKLNTYMHVTSVALCGNIEVIETPIWTKSGGKYPKISSFREKKNRKILNCANTHE